MAVQDGLLVGDRGGEMGLTAPAAALEHEAAALGGEVGVKAEASSRGRSPGWTEKSNSSRVCRTGRRAWRAERRRRVWRRCSILAEARAARKPRNDQAPRSACSTSSGSERRAQARCRRLSMASSCVEKAGGVIAGLREC